MEEKYNQCLDEIQSTTTGNFNGLDGYGIKYKPEGRKKYELFFRDKK